MYFFSYRTLSLDFSAWRVRVLQRDRTKEIYKYKIDERWTFRGIGSCDLKAKSQNRLLHAGKPGDCWCGCMSQGFSPRGVNGVTLSPRMKARESRRLLVQVAEPQSKKAWSSYVQVLKKKLSRAVGHTYLHMVTELGGECSTFLCLLLYPGPPCPHWGQTFPIQSTNSHTNFMWKHFHRQILKLASPAI